MDEMYEFIKEVAAPILTFIVVIVLVVFFVGFCVYKYNVEIAQANIVTIYVAGEKVYSGKTAFIEVDSGGMTTTVKIYKKLFPFPILQQTYSDKDVHIIPKEV